jgi:hypothetical protein
MDPTGQTTSSGRRSCFPPKKAQTMRLVQLNQKLYNNKSNELNEEEFDVYMLSRERERVDGAKKIEPHQRRSKGSDR